MAARKKVKIQAEGSITVAEYTTVFGSFKTPEESFNGPKCLLWEMTA